MKLKEYINKNYVSKRYIRNKIEELKKLRENFKKLNDFNSYTRTNIIIESLEDLLKC